MLLRAIVGVCALSLSAGLVAGCDDGAATKAAEAGRKEAETKLAVSAKKIGELEAEIAKLSAKPAEPAVVAPAPPRLDAEIVRAAATAAGVTKLKLEVEADGTIREMSLYHNDAGALPPAVTALREQQYPGSKVRAYETEFDREHGRVFEVEVTTQTKQECELSAKPDGTLIYNECHISPKELSGPIKSAIEKAVPGAKIVEAEKKTYPDGRAIVSVEVSVGGKMHELYFEGDGLTRHELVLAAEIEVPAQ